MEEKAHIGDYPQIMKKKDIGTFKRVGINIFNRYYVCNKDTFWYPIVSSYLFINLFTMYTNIGPQVSPSVYTTIQLQYFMAKDTHILKGEKSRER